MSELLSFEEGVKKRWVKHVMNGLDAAYEKAGENADSFRQLLLDNPGEGIAQFPTFLRKARDINPNAAFVEAVAGGPNHDWTAPIIDSVGIIYPELSVENRTRSLQMIMSYLDSLRYDYSQNHVERLNEPWLVGDITINSTNMFYWPGITQYSELLSQYATWEELHPHLHEVRSAFFMAFTVSKRKYTNNHIRQNFYHTFPSLTDRTQDAIAAIIYVRAQNAFLLEGTPIQEYVESKLFGYDPAIAPLIMRKIDERKWIDLDRPLYNMNGGPTENGFVDYWLKRSDIKEQ